MKTLHRSFLLLHTSFPRAIITHPHIIPNPQDLRSSSEHKLRYFLWDLRVVWPSIDSNGINTIKVQKRSKEMVKQSMWHQGFNRNFTKLREYCCCAKKKRILFNYLLIIYFFTFVKTICFYFLCTQKIFSVKNQPPIRTYSKMAKKKKDS